MISKNALKHLLSLQKKKKREELRRYIIEGEKMVLEALRCAENEVVNIYGLESFYDKHQISNHKVNIVDERELKQISSMTTPNQVLAEMSFRNRELRQESFYLAIDGVQDPGNFGTILRLADWFGLKQIICSEDCVDVYNPKVVQASMGSILRVDTHYLNLHDFIDANQLPVFGALLNGKNVYNEKLERKGILLMGNEGNGIRRELINSITIPLTIPKFGMAESLNVSMATGILLSEFFRS